MSGEIGGEEDVRLMGVSKTRLRVATSNTESKSIKTPGEEFLRGI